jgi:hypothetical protein
MRTQNFLGRASLRSGLGSMTKQPSLLMLDYARASGDKKFADVIESKARQFYLDDKDCRWDMSLPAKTFFRPVSAKLT